MSFIQPIMGQVGSDVTNNEPQQINDPNGSPITPTPIPTLTGFASDGNGNYIVPAGTPLWLEFPDSLTLESAIAGRSMTLLLWTPLEVLPCENLANSGSPAQVEITRIVRDGSSGEIDALALRVDYLQVGPNQIQLRATQDSEPDDHEVLMPVHDYLVEELTPEEQILVSKWTRFRVFVAVTIALPVVEPVEPTYP
jgi:hypothetical protein